MSIRAILAGTNALAWVVRLVLALANAVPLFAVATLDSVVSVTAWVSNHARSVWAFGALLLLTSAQWWLLGTAATRFLAWRQERSAAV